MAKLQSINPSNYQILGEVEISNTADIKEKVQLARKTQPTWRDLGLTKRVELLRKVMETFKDKKE